MIRELEICNLCEKPDVETVEHEPDAEDETVYYCNQCEEWIDGSPDTAFFKLLQVSKTDLKSTSSEDKDRKDG